MSCLDESMFWTDSVAVLRHLHCTNKAFYTIAASRVSKIRYSLLYINGILYPLSKIRMMEFLEV